METRSSPQAVAECLVSDNEEYIKHGRSYLTQARDPAPHYQHSHIGYNYRLSNLLAAVGRGQLEQLDEKVVKKESDQRILPKNSWRPPWN